MNEKKDNILHFKKPEEPKILATTNEFRDWDDQFYILLFFKGAALEELLEKQEHCLKALKDPTDDDAELKSAWTTNMRTVARIQDATLEELKSLEESCMGKYEWLESLMRDFMEQLKSPDLGNWENEPSEEQILKLHSLVDIYHEIMRKRR